MIEIAIILMMIAIVGAAKKRVPYWKQTTFTTGADKGAVDWLKNGTRIEPSQIEIGTLQQLLDDGYDIPEFLTNVTGNQDAPLGKMAVILRARDDDMRKPLLVHQNTAFKQLMTWLSDVDGLVSHNGEIDIMNTDEQWHIEFTRGKAKFAPYIVNVVQTV